MATPSTVSSSPVPRGPQDGSYEADEMTTIVTDSSRQPTSDDPDDESYPVIEGESFTWRGVLVGLGVGLVICLSNMYFGLQTGWISAMSMPASLMGFGTFKLLADRMKLPFSPVENVLVQSVAGSVGIMPLGCGFVGVMPALQFLLRTEEGGPLILSTWKLIVWSLGLCYFGVLFAVPLRQQVIIRERLRFPSGFSTAVLISVLHGKARPAIESRSGGGRATTDDQTLDDFAGLVPTRSELKRASMERDRSTAAGVERDADRDDNQQEWRQNIRLLFVCFVISGLFTLVAYFIPAARDIPIFGIPLATTWLWTLNPSLAYVGQGIIMGPATTTHMLIGAILGWGILSPIARHRGWAPGDVGDWETGSKGWIVWISLSIMLADAVVSLGILAARPLLHLAVAGGPRLTHILQDSPLGHLIPASLHGYTRVDQSEGDHSSHEAPRSVTPPSPLANLPTDTATTKSRHGPATGDRLGGNATARDAPAGDLIGNKAVATGLVLAIAFCVMCTHIVFGNLVPLYAIIAAVLVALPLSIMGVRALGETDLNPVSGISKLAQLIFALIVPQGHPTSVLINLVAGAVTEAGAMQAGDLMQDLKTGHMLGAAPKAQFWGQMIGGTVGAIVSSIIYKAYTRVYDIPGSLFQVPTAQVWVKTARLVTGQGLPYMATEYSTAFAALFAVITLVRVYTADKPWQKYIPGGIAVAVGMYNVPSFTLARAIGGLVTLYWRSYLGRRDTPLIVVASGLILGEGFLSIVSLLLESARVPHL